MKSRTTGTPIYQREDKGRGQGKERRPKPNNSIFENKPITGRLDEDPTSSRVIRTKASRCKEVFLSPDYQQHRIENRDRNVAAASESSDGPLSTLTSSNEDNSLDFMVDINAGEISISEIFASDFTDFISHDLLTPEMEADKHMSKTAQSQAFEMEQNWSGSDNDIQANLDSDFGSLLAFLESAEEWII